MLARNDTIINRLLVNAHAMMTHWTEPAATAFMDTTITLSLDVPVSHREYDVIIVCVSI